MEDIFINDIEIFEFIKNYVCCQCCVQHADRNIEEYKSCEYAKEVRKKIGDLIITK